MHNIQPLSVWKKKDSSFLIIEMIPLETDFHSRCIPIQEACGNIVDKALCYKPEGHWFETR
jgi:hypothetical protein